MRNPPFTCQESLTGFVTENIPIFYFYTYQIYFIHTHTYILLLDTVCTPVSCSHTHTHTHTHPLPQTHTLSLSLSLSLPFPLSLVLSLSFSLSLSLSLSLSYTGYQIIRKPNGNKRCFSPLLCTVGYTGSGTTEANEMNCVMNHTEIRKQINVNDFV